MKRIIIRLSLFFAVLVLMVIALSVPGFVAASRIPAEPGSSGLLRTALTALCIIVPLSAAVISALCVMMVSKDISLYEQILDSIPFPISVTDINMKWLFVNKPVLDMLGKKRGEFYGKHCSNWGAGICNTDNCGITCLRAGKNTTHFTQFESDFRVDISYVLNSKGNKVGHIELVRDITSESVLKKRQAQTAGQLSSIMATFSDDSRHVSDGAQALALHSTEQAAAAEELSGSILEISGMAKENMNNSTGALNEVEKTGELMAVCSEQMTRMLVAMKMIEDKSQSIGRTTKVIDDIAFQTNILALNAAVEAARAGAHGKGFAVVADEVRNLATKSAEAASETKTLIDSSVASVADGNRIVAQVNESLKAAVEIAKINASKIAGVQSVSVQQSKAMEGITAGISQVSQVVQQNSATAEELASTSTEMNSHLDRINKLILALGQEAGPA